MSLWLCGGGCLTHGGPPRCCEVLRVSSPLPLRDTWSTAWLPPLPILWIWSGFCHGRSKLKSWELFRVWNGCGHCIRLWSLQDYLLCGWWSSLSSLVLRESLLSLGCLPTKDSCSAETSHSHKGYPSQCVSYKIHIIHQSGKSAQESNRKGSSGCIGCGCSSIGVQVAMLLLCAFIECLWEASL